jgi:hypothetical protein
MKAKTRRKLEMGDRALAFSRGHPDQSPGYAASLARLEECLTRAEEMAAQQHEGTVKVRAATARKRDLRRMLRRAHLAHLRSVARVAEQDLPELARQFVLPRGTIPYLAFRTAAHSMADEVKDHKELLVRHGLADTILEGLAEGLKEFDRAVELGIQGRREHVGASAGLDAMANEVVKIVKTMDGLNRYRFAHDAGLLAQWASASNVIATPRSSAAESPAPTDSDVGPAA